MTTVPLELLLCAECGEQLAGRTELRCTSCGSVFDVVDGIPVILPTYDDQRERYRKNYDQIALDDLDSPIVSNRFALLHEVLLRFIGDVDGKRVLDIGSAYGSYLGELTGARQRVAVDIALPYLHRIPPNSGIIRICGDAESLPVSLAAFDVVVISDVLEHLLEPEALVTRMMQELGEEARLIVHIPWQENLSVYEQADYEFTHMRRFDEASFRTLFWGFDVIRERSSLPRLDGASVFRLKGKIPQRVYNALVAVYFRTDMQQLEYRYRERWIAELPRRERLLLRLFEPQVKLFELRVRRGPSSRLARRLFRRWLERVEARRAPAPSETPEAARD